MILFRFQLMVQVRIWTESLYALIINIPKLPQYAGFRVISACLIQGKCREEGTAFQTHLTQK
jgi:hypothetical protein